jgi:hypothetical protein
MTPLWGRAVWVHDGHVKVRLKGLTAIAALRREMCIPIPAIRSMSTDVPPRVQVRVVGTSVPFTSYRQGTFRHDSRRMFLSFEDRLKTVTFELSRADWDEPYDVVVLGVPDPSRLVRAVEVQRVRMSAS